MKIPRGLISFAVFVFVLVVEHGEVRLVTALRNVVVFDGFEYCTARFVGVRTVTEAALLGEFKDFLEVACQLFALHVEGAETLDAWGVDEPTFRGER